MIRQEFVNEPYDLKENGRFVLFNIKTARHALSAAGLSKVAFTYTPTPTRESHADIEHLPTASDLSLHAAVIMKRTVLQSYPAL